MYCAYVELDEFNEENLKLAKKRLLKYVDHMLSIANAEKDIYEPSDVEFFSLPAHEQEPLTLPQCLAIKFNISEKGSDEKNSETQESR